MNRLSRRELLATAGALTVSFALSGELAAQSLRGMRAARGDGAPGSLRRTPLLDSWIRVHSDGRVTVFTGKAELGQGIETAIIQVAAEQLDLGPQHIELVTADTGRTPNEGYTAGSRSMEDSATAVMNAAAQARELLLAQASRRLGLPVRRLRVADGVVLAPDGRRVSYGTLAADLSLHVRARAHSRLKPPVDYTVMGRSLPRVDIPGKLYGRAAFVQDLRLPGMLHARVVRPPSYGAKLLAADTSRIAGMPGVVKVIREASYLAVVAAGEWQAVEALHALQSSAHWQPGEMLPDESRIDRVLQSYPSQPIPVLNTSGSAVPVAHTVRARFTRPYLMHGSIGPSCAVALLEGDRLTVWTHSQGVYPLRTALSQLLRMAPGNIRCIYSEGAGCYGHNGADDAAADAALIARALPGHPIRVQWMREQEHQWEPYGPAMIVEASASVDGRGRIADWQYEIWSNTHSTRPFAGGLFVQNQTLPDPLPVPPPRPLPLPAGGGDRNAIPQYRLGTANILYHFIARMPLRVSALRSLGGQMNVFCIESLIDELALAAGADPVEFRLQHLVDPRASAVVDAAARDFGWSSWRAAGPHSGRGFAFARYEDSGAYCAVALELSVQPSTGRVALGRIAAAVDSGQAVNPNGIRNQVEGAILQAASWTLFEEVQFDRWRITSIDWGSYPILRFGSAPRALQVRVINRPGAPFLGTGEAGQGPASAAIANAVAHASGRRFYDLPLSPTRLAAALAAADH